MRAPVQMHPASGVGRLKLPPQALTDRVTKTEDLFAIAHLGVPRIDPEQWFLTIDGLVARKRQLSLAQLRARPKKVLEAVHQCCGNPLEPQVPTRRIANGRWGGADLAALLDDLGVDGEARYLWSRGLDHGTFAGVACDGYTKDLPLQRLREGDVLIAYELNGEPLPPEQGFPARLLVPGYYGTNNVKWLSRLTLAKTRAGGPFVRRRYNDVVEHPAGQPRCNPVWAIAPDSVIVSPAPDQSFALGSVIEIWGWAWSDGAATALDVSFDAGVRWATARLDPPSGRSWQRFTTIWAPKAPGRYEIIACARAAEGRKQPSVGARNAIHRVAVEVV